MYHNIAFLLAVSLLCLVFCSGFDVSFIPNDENAPLPQSKKYRDSLRKLCVLIRTEGAILPPEVEKKKPILEKVCLKLQKDDENIESGLAEAKSGSSTKQTFLYLLIGAGSGYYLWNNRGWLKRTVTNLLDSRNGRNVIGGDNFRGGAAAVGTAPNVATLDSHGSSHSTATAGPTTTISSGTIVHSVPVIELAADPAKVAEARAARLKRFSALNTVSSSVNPAVE